MTHANDSRISCSTAGARSLPFGYGRNFLSPLRTLQMWYERSRQRHRLAQLDDHLLRDIGIDRAAAMEEAYKPFWQD